MFVPAVVCAGVYTSLDLIVVTSLMPARDDTAAWAATVPSAAQLTDSERADAYAAAREQARLSLVAQLSQDGAGALHLLNCGERLAHSATRHR